MSKKRTDKVIPNVVDKRDKINKSDNIIISNYQNLDKVKDKTKIDKLIKEHQKVLHNPYYSIDLNTNKVKQNERVSFIVKANKPFYTDLNNLEKKLQYNDEILECVYKNYIDLMNSFNKKIDDFLYKDYSNTQELDNDIYNFNNYFDTNYYNGFNLKVKNFLDEDIKKNYVNKYADAIANTQYVEIKNDIDSFIDFAKVDLEKSDIKSFIDEVHLKDLQNKIIKFLNEDNKGDLDNYVFDLIKKYVYLDEIKTIDADLKTNKKYYTDVKSLYKTIDDKIIKIVDNFNNYYKKLNNDTPTNYDIVKFKTNNDIVSKIDPIAKNLLNGINYEIGKFIKTPNNYNDKSYGAVFSIKTADLSNIDIIQELQQKGIKINHFGKKIIDDVDVLLDENKGNVNNNDRLVALTPKMIARKVYNKEQPTKKQIQEIDEYLRYLSNIYLFFVKDDASAVNIEKLVKLKDKGLKYLQDEEGNILNIGDTLDDNIILNASYGYSKKYKSFVYVFDNKSIFERVNQIINNDVGKQLLLSLKDKADEIFNDYNKNVNQIVVGTRHMLFERVNQIKHSIGNNKKVNKEILLSNIYDEYNITTPKQKVKVRNIIKNILNYWVDINYIVSYEFLDKTGNTIQKNSTTEIHKIYLNVKTITTDND